MKASHRSLMKVGSCVLLLLVPLLVGWAVSKDRSQPIFLQSILGELPAGQETCHFLIYIDIDACLACTEDMDAWIELENELPKHGCSFSLWAPPADSFDVAYAMELEGLKTPVRTLSVSTLEGLGWADARTPIRALLDNSGHPLHISGPMGHPDQSRKYTVRLLEDLCSHE